ncbi:MAG: type II toxin-antitoxin system VapC family toxin [Actinomycetota bacterium]|nr:type II toxin-antitoxin system VapC family toxin [Actinomycetota bacterium]
MKLVLAEAESRALRQALRTDVARVSSALLVVESGRAAMRSGGTAVARTRSALRGVTVVPIDDTVIALAAGLDPSQLRSLDAIHLATALSLGETLDSFYCCDARLAEAADALGLRFTAPA